MIKCGKRFAMSYSGHISLPSNVKALSLRDVPIIANAFKTKILTFAVII